MIKAGEPIEFRALARTASVSVNFLYGHDELCGQQDEVTPR